MNQDRAKLEEVGMTLYQRERIEKMLALAKKCTPSYHANPWARRNQECSAPSRIVNGALNANGRK